jgi:hypothetical protein
MNQAQRKQLAAFALRKAIGQTRSLLYVEGQTVTVPVSGHRTKTVLKAIRSWTVDAYRKPAKKESDKNVKLADHDAVFTWQGFDQFGVKAALPLRDAFLVDGGRGETWQITHVKPIETFDALYIVTCKPFFNLELSNSHETEASAGIGISASASFSVTDLIFIRPPVVSPASIDLSADWKTVPFSVFGPPPALQGDVRTACISSVQAVGASCIEFELQRSVEPEGGKIWERVGSGFSQVNGWGYCRMVWNDEPPWIAPGNLLRYRVRARLVSGYASIFNPEFTVKTEMIVQRTQGYIATSFTGTNLISGPVLIGSLPGRYITQVVTKIDGDFGCNLNVGTESTTDLYGNFEGIGDHVGFVYKRGNAGAIQVSAAGTPNAMASGEVAILFS